MPEAVVSCPAPRIVKTWSTVQHTSSADSPPSPQKSHRCKYTQKQSPKRNRHALICSLENTTFPFSSGVLVLTSTLKTSLAPLVTSLSTSLVFSSRSCSETFRIRDMASFRVTMVCNRPGSPNLFPYQTKKGTKRRAKGMAEVANKIVRLIPTAMGIETRFSVRTFHKCE